MEINQSGDVVLSEVHHDQFYQSLIDTNIFGDDDVGERGDHVHNTVNDSRCTTTFDTSIDGDPAEKDLSFAITLTHFRATSVSLVGLQVWRGSLLLADYLVSHHSVLDLDNARVIELAAGTGITSITCAALGAKSVLCTDVDRGQILDTIRGNFEANQQLCGECVVQVEEIDFFKPVSWRRKLSREIAECNLILAADVVYSQEITSSFFNALSDLIEDNQSKDVRVLIAIERRNRVDERGRVAAPNFDHFLNCLRKFEEVNAGAFSAKRIPLDFRQYFKSYERVTELHLWLIRREKKCC